MTVLRMKMSMHGTKPKISSPVNCTVYQPEPFAGKKFGDAIKKFGDSFA